MRVFINYRRADTLAAATRLQRELEEKVDGSAFLDHRKLQGGQRWPDELRRELKAADIVLVAIGSEWLTLQNEHGIRRLDAPRDWVRTEIEVATKAGKPIIPLLVDGAQRPAADAFPTSPALASLAALETLPLCTEEWDDHVGKLVTRLVGLGAKLRAPGGGQQASRPSPVQSNIPARGEAPFVGRDSLLAELGEVLTDGSDTRLVVLHGQPGVGKSQLAREYAYANRDSYPGGSFVVSFAGGGLPADLARIGAVHLELELADLSVKNQCIRTLMSLGCDSQCLLIYDGVQDPQDVTDWLPTEGQCCHVVVTSNALRWSAAWKAFRVNPLSDSDSHALVQALAGKELAEQHGEAIVAVANGLPVQLVPTASSLRYGDRGDRLAVEASESLARPWAALAQDAQTLLFAASFFVADRVRPDVIQRALKEVSAWADSDFHDALRCCRDMFILSGEDPLLLHQVWIKFIRETSKADQPPFAEIRSRMAREFVTAAQSAAGNPGDTGAVQILLAFDSAVAGWEGDTELLGSGTEMYAIGRGLSEVGQFSLARPWLELAVAKMREGHIDHTRFAKSLFQLGWCLSEEGDCAAARPFFEQAVVEARKGDVDYESLVDSLHEVGWCLKEQGDSRGALHWFKDAVAAAEQGNLDGKINHASLGKSLHEVACRLSEENQFSEAREWAERAVDQQKRGDIHGRIDHPALGASYHEIGWCLSNEGKFTEAYDWFERAAEEAKKGDLHGRINHDQLGQSLHRAAGCLASTGNHRAARSCYKQAIAAKQKGDLFGRVNEKGLEATRDALAALPG